MDEIELKGRLRIRRRIEAGPKLFWEKSEVQPLKEFENALLYNQIFVCRTERSVTIVHNH